jgi:hypothetical protein
MNEMKKPNSAEIAAAMASWTPPRTIDKDDLTEALIKLDLYIPGLSYQETAEKIMDA